MGVPTLLFSKQLNCLSISASLTAKVFVLFQPEPGTGQIGIILPDPDRQPGPADPDPYK
jgi:hypothetical protein